MQLVHEKEDLYFTLCLAFSILVYLLLVFSIIGLVYLVLGLITTFIMQGLFVGALRGNGIVLSERQFGEVYTRADRLARQMGFTEMPAIIIVQSGGMLNAFATRFLGRNFVVLYSDIFELAYEEGEEALDFIICHELAHIKQRHLYWNWLLFPAVCCPFLAQAYSRACEYTCDRFAAYHSPDGAEAGLLILAVGKRLYKNISVEEYLLQPQRENGFWVWLAEMLASHPNLPKRVQGVRTIIECYLPKGRTVAATILP